MDKKDYDYTKVGLVEALTCSKAELIEKQKDLKEFVERGTNETLERLGENANHDYLCRAFAAYYSDVTMAGLGTKYYGADVPEEGFGHGIPDFLMSYTVRVIESGRAYAVLSNAEGEVFAFYRIGNQGQLRRLIRLPKELKEYQ